MRRYRWSEGALANMVDVTGQSPAITDPEPKIELIINLKA